MHVHVGIAIGRKPNPVCEERIEDRCDFGRREVKQADFALRIRGNQQAIRQIGTTGQHTDDPRVEHLVGDGFWCSPFGFARAQIVILKIAPAVSLRKVSRHSTPARACTSCTSNCALKTVGYQPTFD